MLSPPAASAPGQGSFCYPEWTPGQPPSLSPRNALGVAPSPSIAWRHEPRAGAAPGPASPVPALPHARPLLSGGAGEPGSLPHRARHRGLPWPARRGDSGSGSPSGLGLAAHSLQGLWPKRLG